MASRLITDEVSKSNKLPELSADALNIFFLLIPHLSVHGKSLGDPHYVKGKVCSKFKRFTPEKIKRCLKEISDKTNVKWFDVDGIWYIHSLNYEEHQPGLRKDRAGKDPLPDFPCKGYAKKTALTEFSEEKLQPTQLIEKIELRDNSGQLPEQSTLGSRMLDVRCRMLDGGSRMEEGKSGLTPDSPPPKNLHGEFKNVKLTGEEFEKLKLLYGSKTVSDYIEKLSGYLKAKGKKYQDHYATLLNWLRKDGVAPYNLCTSESPMPPGEKDRARWRHPETKEVKHKDTGRTGRKCLHCNSIQEGT